MPGIMQGTTPIIRLRPIGISVSDLGTPAMAITQDGVYIELEATVDTAGNSVWAKMTEEETMRLVPGIARIQVIWQNEDTDDVYRFPVHEVSVEQTLMGEYGQTLPIPGDDTEDGEDTTITVETEDDELVEEDPPAIWLEDDYEYDDDSLDDMDDVYQEPVDYEEEEVES